MRPALSAKRDLSLVEGPISLPTIKTSATAEAGDTKGHFCRPLPSQFRHGGFDYQQIHRQGDFAIYRQTSGGNEHSAAFEIIRIRRREGFHIDDRFVEPAEVIQTPKRGAPMRLLLRTKTWRSLGSGNSRESHQSNRP